MRKMILAFFFIPLITIYPNLSLSKVSEDISITIFPDLLNEIVLEKPVNSALGLNFIYQLVELKGVKIILEERELNIGHLLSPGEFDKIEIRKVDEYDSDKAIIVFDRDYANMFARRITPSKKLSINILFLTYYEKELKLIMNELDNLMKQKQIYGKCEDDFEAEWEKRYPNYTGGIGEPDVNQRSSSKQAKCGHLAASYSKTKNRIRSVLKNINGVLQDEAYLMKI